MLPPYPSYTSEWHNDTYDAINPSKPELNQAGKTVIITGAGSGIGRATAIAFAEAGAARLILIGRTEATLQETAKLLPGESKAEIFPASVTDASKLRNIAEQIGEWDIFISNAAQHITLSTVMDASIEDWWGHYETNVKSVVIAAQAFIPRAKQGASFYTITAGGINVPKAAISGGSGYFTSKVAQNSVVEWLAEENPHIFFCAVHPGIIDTLLLRKAGLIDSNSPNVDTVELPAHFLVWLSQPKTKFLNGRMVWANWDVEELEARAEEIKKSDVFTINCVGWPYSPQPSS